nr:hypothetical protein [Marinicella sp. W31]MDC2877444.1 hypothetical protein [Marinicella sp. W31]
MNAYRLRQDYPGDGTRVVFPAEVPTRLYTMLGEARQGSVGDCHRCSASGRRHLLSAGTRALSRSPAAGIE